MVLCPGKWFDMKRNRKKFMLEKPQDTVNIDTFIQAHNTREQQHSFTLNFCSKKSVYSRQICEICVSFLAYNFWHLPESGSCMDVELEWLALTQVSLHGGLSLLLMKATILETEISYNLNFPRVAIITVELDEFRRCRQFKQYSNFISAMKFRVVFCLVLERFCDFRIIEETRHCLLN